MSRLFDGVDDTISFDPGGALPTLQNGAFTLVYAIRINDNHRGGLYDGKALGTRRFGINPFDNGSIFLAVAGVATVSVDYTALIDEWAILAFSKPAGSAQARVHTYIFDTDTWSHADMGLISGNGSGTVDEVTVGLFDSGQYLSANVGAVAIWKGTALSDGNIETLPAGGTAWVDLAPTVLWDFHGDPGTPITDLANSGADESAIVGTTDALGEDPPGFSYDFDFGPPEPPNEGDSAITFYLRAHGEGLRDSAGTVEFGLRFTLTATGDGTSPPSTRRPSKLTARARTAQLTARGGYVNA